MTPTLFLAAGHGGRDSGNTASGNIEAKETIAAVDGAINWMRANGVKDGLGGCVMLPHNLDLSGQIKAINDWKLTPPDLALDVHLDYKAGQSGALVLYDEHAHSREFAKRWLSAWCEKTGIRNNGAYRSKEVAMRWRGWSDFGWCAPRFPGLILELGCINSPSDLGAIRRPENRLLLGRLCWEIWQEVAGLAPTPSTGMAIRHPERITFETWQAVLNRFDSPVKDIALDLWFICVHNSIDPAVALAFFAKESTFGTRGRSAGWKSWGNVRVPYRRELATWNLPGGVQKQGDGLTTFAVYDNWQNSLQDWCERMNGRYVDRGLDTVEKAIPVYAPSSDGNDVQQYIKFVVDHVAQWQRGEV